jgi:hypothetical protein
MIGRSNSALTSVDVAVFVLSVLATLVVVLGPEWLWGRRLWLLEKRNEPSSADSSAGEETELVVVAPPSAKDDEDGSDGEDGEREGLLSSRGAGAPQVRLRRVRRDSDPSHGVDEGGASGKKAVEGSSVLDVAAYFALASIF